MTGDAIGGGVFYAPSELLAVFVCKLMAVAGAHAVQGTTAIFDNQIMLCCCGGVKGARYGRLVDLKATAEALPTEFRLFRAGVNETSKGPIVFDEGAAQSVMAEYAKQGVDVAIDLAHDSIDDNARMHRSDADDARGWCQLEVREGPELWAVNVKWTPDGERRLREKTQRYVSPVVFVDDNDHAVAVFNIALCSMPATYGAMPLVAATKGKTAAQAADNGGNMLKALSRHVVQLAGANDEGALVALGMSPEQAKKAITAVKDQNGEAALAFVEELLAESLGVSADAEPEPEEEPLEGAPAEPAAEDEDEEGDKVMATTLRRLLRVDSAVAAIATVKQLRARVDALELERRADEHVERVALVGKLVALGAELPVTAYKDVTADKPELTEELASKSIKALRARVAAFEAAGPRQVELRAPERSDAGLTLLEKTLANKMKPEQREAFLSRRARKQRAS